MRIWKDEKGNLLTDEQVLKAVAACGSLSAAAAANDIALMDESESATCNRVEAQPGQMPRRSLEYYLAQLD
ncbi:hypothetical protein [Curtanaerobium respiraculi]|uniref:hypothetical protein n=1 Tax=Curtanaerobium respiraculi TaxID=2949669 RepID=UPI0024B35818|nr:hypothetical protein [Curtanaerobium respiraculi]